MHSKKLAPSHARLLERLHVSQADSNVVTNLFAVFGYLMVFPSVAIAPLITYTIRLLNTFPRLSFLTNGVQWNHASASVPPDTFDGSDWTDWKILARTRRVKCGEERPVCQRCVTAGYICKGYDTPDQAVRKNESLSISPTCAVARSPSTQIFASEQEYQAFSLFRHTTIQQLCGFHIVDLWTYHAPQTACLDPGIRHGLVALAAVHDCYNNNGISTPDREEFALEHYILAIKSHLITMSSTDSSECTRKSIISCIIFVCIELLHGRMGSAALLINQGVKLLKDTYGDFKFRDMKDVEHTFRRLQLQVVKLYGSKGQEYIADSPENPSFWPTPRAFRTFTEAKDFLDFLIYVASHEVEDIDPFVVAQGDPGDVLEAGTRLQQWSDAFDALSETETQDGGVNEVRAANVLKAQRMLYYCVTAIPHPRQAIDAELVWDQYVPLLENIVATAESTFGINWRDDIRPLDETSAEQSLSTRTFDRRIKRTFTLDTGAVAPMYDVACRCRDPIIRRRAVNVLRLTARQEGLFDGFLAGRIAYRVILMEERGLTSVQSCSDIPLQNRILRVRRDIHPEQRKIDLWFYPYTGIDEPIACETIDF
ncbi:hypothetical protein K461DRAFT_316012 [Myriangium duriaei CBS 260.36]|uniref:Zn(2)-C6 fungal-type domain-containing protein n=1 Tax=Myriangium duriaei CBS 260.36 TaxID=1168546 RepID=A0A9P4IV84_9PEZI|nr:hypothetical protein K461DRAFT_316012 [Myriangium duriaei CBS 260.36]